MKIVKTLRSALAVCSLMAFALIGMSFTIEDAPKSRVVEEGKKRNLFRKKRTSAL